MKRFIKVVSFDIYQNYIAKFLLNKKKEESQKQSVFQKLQIHVIF